MEKMIRLLGMSMLAAFMSACASKEDISTEVNANDQVISFTFSGLNYRGITYDIATAPEYQADNLDIYMFEHTTGGDGTFHRKWNSDDADCTVARTGLTTQTISLSGGTDFGPDAKTFYFAANPAQTTSLDASGLTEAQFAELLTDALPVTSGKGDLLSVPLLFTGKSGAVDPRNPTGNTVTMKRRVARFDIVNAYENFVIEKVLISDAKLQGYVFGNALGTGSPTLPTASLKEIAPIPDYVTQDNERISCSVFYLYPTTIGKTGIAIQARLNGEPADLYYLDTAVETEIEANHRYKLVIHEDITYGSYYFTLVYADWDEGEKIEVKETKALDLIDVAFDPDNEANLERWDANSKTFDMTHGTASKMTFTVKNPLNLTWSASVVGGDAAHVEAMPAFTSTATLTYGAEVSHACEAVLPQFKETLDRAVTIRLRVQNAARTGEYADIFFRCEPAIRLALKRTKEGKPFTAANVPFGLRVFNFPNPATEYSGPLQYDDLPAATAVYGSYNTRKWNTDQGWTFVSWGNEPNVTWDDYNEPGAPLDLYDMEASLKPHPTRTGFYQPLASNNRNLWWQKVDIAQGVPIEDPFPLNHYVASACISVTVNRTDLGKDPDTSEPIVPSDLWVAIYGQARACDFFEAEASQRPRNGLPLAVALAVDQPKINGTTASWDYFGTFGSVEPTSADPSRKFEVRLMYRDKTLATQSYKRALEMGEKSDVIFSFDDKSKISITLIINGWVISGGDVVI